MNDERSATNGTEQPAPTIGLYQRFESGEREHVEQVLDDLAALGVEHLRTTINGTGGDGEVAWVARLLPRLSEAMALLPCIAGGARRTADYAAFVDRLLDQCGDRIEWIELAPFAIGSRRENGHANLDAEDISAAFRAAVEVARDRGKKIVLGGVDPSDTRRLDRMGDAGLLAQVDAIGVHAFPNTTDNQGTAGWDDVLGSLDKVLARHDADPAVWITSTGYAARHHDEYRQLQAFVAAIEAPVDRIYWGAVRDRAAGHFFQNGSNDGGRHSVLGLRRGNGRPRLLFRVWAEKGIDGAEALAELGRRDGETEQRSGEAPRVGSTNGRRPVLITGGAGFVGANLAHHLLSDGEPVLIYDNLSRPGVERNLRWLIDAHGSLLSWTVDDVRNPRALRAAVRHAAHVYHFAGQVAVTTSLERPDEDFAVNARGTLNLLEALRRMDDPPPLVFTSTNKVYGRLEDLALREEATRYVPTDERVRTHGISEARPISFHSPYGCSKGAAEQYVLDYARTYGLPALVFRMSCVYGTRQFGSEDQGWVSHFVQRTLAEAPITLYGDGKQVRDVLFIEDLVRALRMAQAQVDTLAGAAYNIGGGPNRAVSLIELIDLAAGLHGTRPSIRFSDWRRGDQKYFVADTRKFSEATGWAPEIGVREGVTQLYRWLERASVQVSDRYALTVQKEAC